LTTQAEAWGLVEKNMGLGHVLVERFLASTRNKGQRFGTSFKDDLYSAIPVALYNAALRFDASKGIKFTSYAGRAVWNEFSDEYRRYLRQTGGGNLRSADSVEYESDRLGHASQDEYKLVEFRDEFEKMPLSGKEHEILDLTLEGYSIDEIGKITSLSSDQIRGLKQRMKDKLTRVGYTIEPTTTAKTLYPPSADHSWGRHQKTEQEDFPSFDGSLEDQNRQDPEFKRKHREARRKDAGDARVMEEWAKKIKAEGFEEVD
jgi:RNA polymerase sigma factor (sigma-70 family)